MPLFPEREPKIKPFEERAEDASPLIIERKEVVTPTPTQFTKQVVDEGGKNIIETPQTREIAIELPAEEKALEEASKGSVQDSLTWFAAFWVRMVQKAVYFGWKIVKKNAIKAGG